MAIPQFNVDMDIISKLGDYPGSDDGLTPAGFRGKFDMAGKFLKEYINTILLPELNQLVDVEALLAGILDDTLTQADKAAPAKYVGDIIRNLAQELSIQQAKAFEKTVHSGDYVLGTDQVFNATQITVNEFRIFGGEVIVQGHVMPLNVGSYATINVADGIYGIYRNDLICARYERNAEGIESNRIVLIEGEANQAGGVDPNYMTDDVNVMGAVVHDVPLYRVSVTNVDVTLEKLFAPKSSLAALVAEEVIEQLPIWEGGNF